MSEQPKSATPFVIERVNLRQRRAEALTAAIMQRIEPHICTHGGHDHRRMVWYLLQELFADRGVEIITDVDRAQCGLPPRGNDGWTADELLAMEHLRIEVMRRPFTVTVS